MRGRLLSTPSNKRLQLTAAHFGYHSCIHGRRPPGRCLTRGRPPVDTWQQHGAAAAEPRSVRQRRQELESIVSTSWRTSGLQFAATLGLLACSSPGSQLLTSSAPPLPVAPPPPPCNVTIDQCQQKRCHGYVHVKYDIEPDGSVTNQRVTASCPEGYFDRAALEAVSDWKYDPTSNAR